MKNLILMFVCFAFAVSAVFAQCENELTLEKTGAVLKELQIGKDVLPDGAEIVLEIVASVPSASWERPDAEAAVVTVFVDGKYNQDVMLFAGENSFNYQARLGRLTAAPHKIQIALNNARSAKLTRKVRIEKLNYAGEDLTPDNQDDAAKMYQPLIYLRPNTIDKFSDIPLLMYYEVLPSEKGDYKIRYTVIFTNEDGGTPALALMARWGRQTDIEWIYEIEVKNNRVISEIYQAANHQTDDFAGKRFGTHPLILDATDNNNFADAGCTALRVAPILVKADLSRKSRETVMDENGWIYRIMAQEAIRENRIDPTKRDAFHILDVRDYVYVEIETKLDKAAVALEVETVDNQKFVSDANNALLRVNRDGFVRIAVPLPNNAVKQKIKSISIVCNAIGAAAGSCQTLNVLKLVTLDQNFLPRGAVVKANAQSVKTGEQAVFPIRPLR